VKQKIFPIVRDSRSLEEKVKEGFIYVDPHITSQNFGAAVGVPGAGEAVLVNFEEYLFSEEALRRLDRLALRPGLPTELADLSKNHPDSTELAGCFPLVALGDSWVGPLGNLLVVYLVGDARGREMSLHWRGSGWADTYWFLGFRT
jgi:hypothetical protein